MRLILLTTIAALLFFSCKKNKFTTNPQISFKSISPDSYKQGSTSTDILPVLTITVTDAEGDLGFKTGKDTSFIYLRNLRTNNFDSVSLPDIMTSATKNFQADISIKMFQFLRVPNTTKKDTLYYDIYIKDFAKNKSNVLRTEKPIYYFP